MTMRALDVCRDEWRLLVDVQFKQAEEACNGYLIRNDRRHEFRTLHGMGTYTIQRILFASANHVAARYASEELNNFWRYNPKTSFAEFAYDAGFRHRFIMIEKRRRDGNYRTQLWAA